MPFSVLIVQFNVHSCHSGTNTNSVAGGYSPLFKTMVAVNSRVRPTVFTCNAVAAATFMEAVAEDNQKFRCGGVFLDCIHILYRNKSSQQDHRLEVP